MDLRRYARDLLESVWSRGREDLLRAAVAPEFTHRLATAGATDDVNGYLALVRSHRAAFSPIDLIFHRALAEDERVAVHFSMTGVHVGPAFGLAPTGRLCFVEVMSVLHFEAGALLRQHSVTDFLALQRQIRGVA